MPNNNIAFIIGDSQADIGAAQEVNGNISVPTDTVVMMKFAGYDGTNQPLFLFQFESTDPNFLPATPPDHRVNWNGGFAFSVYHPGTGLPQQPWSM